MKKLSAAAVLILLIILSACAYHSGARDDIPPYVQSSDGCIYFQDESLIKRLDPEGGRISVVCPDPICEPDEDGNISILKEYILLNKRKNRRVPQYMTGAYVC